MLANPGAQTHKSAGQKYEGSGSAGIVGVESLPDGEHFTGVQQTANPVAYDTSEIFAALEKKADVRGSSRSNGPLQGAPCAPSEACCAAPARGVHPVIQPQPLARSSFTAARQRTARTVGVG